MSSYYRFPLRTDLRDSMTMLRVEPTADGRVRVQLHRGVDRSAFAVRFGHARPSYEPVEEPTETLTLPAPAEPGLTEPEVLLGQLGVLLVRITQGWDDDDVYPWPLDGLLPHEEWLLHVRVLCSTHERIEPARASDVFDDPRVQDVVGTITAGVTPHTEALRRWLARATVGAEDARAATAHEARERRVRAVLQGLGAGMPEDTRERPNPELSRIRPSSTAQGAR